MWRISYPSKGYLNLMRDIKEVMMSIRTDLRRYHVMLCLRLSKAQGVQRQRGRFYLRVIIVQWVLGNLRLMNLRVSILIYPSQCSHSLSPWLLHPTVVQWLMWSRIWNKSRNNFSSVKGINPRLKQKRVLLHLGIKDTRSLRINFLKPHQSKSRILLNICMTTLRERHLP